MTLGYTNKKVNVLAYGAVGDGVANDATAIQAAITMAETYGGTVFIPNGIYNVGTASFSFDSRKTSIEGDSGTVLRWTGAPTAGYAIRITAPGYTYTTRYLGQREAISKLKLLGGGQTSQFAGTGVLFYGAPGAPLSQISATHITVQGFAKVVEYTDHVYKITLDEFYTQWGTVETPNTTVDFGETMVIQNSFFADFSGGQAAFRKGEWKLINTSFNNCVIRVTNDAVVDMNGMHPENPGASNGNNPYIWMDMEASVIMRGVHVIHNTPSGGARTVPLIQNDVTSVANGLVLIGCIFYCQANTTYNTAPTYNHHMFVSGTGKIRALGCLYKSWTNAQYISLGYGAQVLRNGNFETGTIAGWTATSSGGGTHTAISQAITKKTGTYALDMYSTWASTTGYSTVYQEFKVSPNDIVVGGSWFRADFSAAGASSMFATYLRFYDDSNAELQTDGYTSRTTTDADFVYKRYGAVAPAGATKCRVMFDLRIQTSGSARVYVDDVLINIIGGR